MSLINEESSQEESASSEEAASVESNSMIGDTSPTLGDGEYFQSEGIKGAGEVPDWYMADKYKSVADQAKAYPDLQKKFGSFTGKPKDGYQLPADVDREDALVAEVLKFGDETNMNQAGVEKLLRLSLQQSEVSQQVNVEAEISKLGENSGERLKTIENFMKNNLDNETYEKVRESVKDADTVVLVEALIKATAPTKLPIEGGENPTGMTWADIEVEMIKKDEFGNFLQSTDRNHYNKVQRLFRDFGGDLKS